jgi:hypothetical protein
MKINEIRNGSLYFNRLTGRVERVIGQVSKVRVLSYHHKQDEGSVQVKQLRRATKQEVDDYLTPPAPKTKLQALRERVESKLSDLKSLITR